MFPDAIAVGVEGSLDGQFVVRLLKLSCGDLLQQPCNVIGQKRLNQTWPVAKDNMRAARSSESNVAGSGQG